MLYIPSLDILYRGTESGFGTPVLDDRRALEAQIDFAEQGGTVVDQHAVFDGDQPYPLTCQRFADFPLPALHLDFPLQIHLQHPGSRWILPLWWLRIVPPTAGPPHTGGSSHVQGFVRAYVVVFPSVSIQPRLQVLARNSSPAQRPLQRAVEALDFSLRLRMTHPAPAQPNARRNSHSHNFRLPDWALWLHHRI